MCELCPLSGGGPLFFLFVEKLSCILDGPYAYTLAVALSPRVRHTLSGKSSVLFLG